MGESDDLGIVIEASEPATEPAPEPTPPDEAATPPAPDENPDSPSPDDDKQKAIAEYAIKARIATRKAKELEQRLQELEAKSSETARPAVPDLPDPLALTEQQFAQKAKERDEAIRQAAIHDAQQADINRQRKALEEEAQRKQQEEFSKAVQGYSQTAVKLGLKPEELKSAGERVAQFGIHTDLVNLIIEDEHGPLITKYLSTNLEELEALNSMSPIKAAARIAKVIAPKAAALKPRVSNAPDPVEPVRGGAVPHKSLGPEGATFE